MKVRSSVELIKGLIDFYILKDNMQFYEDMLSNVLKDFFKRQRFLDQKRNWDFLWYDLCHTRDIVGEEEKDDATGK